MPDLTPWESEILRFPGDVPGVLRRGSPVVVAFDAHASIHGVVIQPDVIAIRDGGLADIYEVGVGEMFDIAPDQVTLDLTDATGRAHLAWWLAEKMKNQLVHCAVVFYGRGADDWEHAWCLSYWGARFNGSTTLHRDGDDGPLADIDPRDRRLLPDGSRLVDAIALGIIARHVAGLPIPQRPEVPRV